ncbi:MAG TPA: pyruvate, phosphate dikinase [Polyangia bacterium]
MAKYVYFFGEGKADGNGTMKELLGGKGAGLAEMTNLGIPVPPGFTCTTEVCTYYYDHGQSYPKELQREVEKAVARIEKIMGRKFGDPHKPLLFSVRSGARASMPGMMDTVLNLGLNDETCAALAALSGNERFAWDSYRRFVAMYGDVVLGLKPVEKKERDPFDVILERTKEELGVEFDSDLPADALKGLVAEFKREIKRRKGVEFPEDAWQQLWGAIGAVFGSWNNSRAISYRKMYDIPDDWGTAVNVQTMVFGNLGETSGTGVGFTRNPATGEDELYGEFLMNAQGEDVVAGIRTPKPIAELKAIMPSAYTDLSTIIKKLERHYRNMQDFEFTIENEKLWMLQTRNGKRTGFAAVRIAVDLVDERTITKEEALMQVEDPDGLNQLLRPVFDTNAKKQALGDGRVVAKGLAAGPGAASGRVVFHASDAEDWAGTRGEKVLLVRHETSPEDIRGMNAAQGILTAHGGMTSHAALVARQMGKVCIVGCGTLDIDYQREQMKIRGTDVVIKEGDWVSIDGTTGEVILGKIETKPSEVLQVLLEKTLDANDSPIYQRYQKFMAWCDEARRLKIRTNADQPDQAATAVAFGAEGIGLCRTEHMFFGGERILFVRQMILSNDELGRRKALAKLEVMQKDDFAGIFRAMGGRPVTVRLLDPPLHEFLPHTTEEIAAVARELDVSPDVVLERNNRLHEFNPMLGHRGCRLGITYPEIYEMQIRAIIEAACDLAAKGEAVTPEIMIPIVGIAKELQITREQAVAICDETIKRRGVKVKYTVGTMIELPRACLVADQIAKYADFFSFGTNDLTQTTFGFSRDDVRGFLPYYLARSVKVGDQDRPDPVLDWDPFVRIDEEGMGQLMRLAVDKGRSIKPELKIGICGEHGGQPQSVKFCHRLGFSYVSCSPYRVPIARLSAAQASIEEKRGAKAAKPAARAPITAKPGVVKKAQPRAAAKAKAPAPKPKAPAKKAPVKKAPAKAPAKKVPAKAPAKKVPAKAPAKKAPARKTPKRKR